MKKTIKGLVLATGLACLQALGQVPLPTDVSIEKIYKVQAIEKAERVELILEVAINNPSTNAIRIHDGKVSVTLVATNKDDEKDEGRPEASEIFLGTITIPEGDDITKPKNSGKGEIFLEPKQETKVSLKIQMPEAPGELVELQQFKTLRKAQNILNDGGQRYAIRLKSPRDGGAEVAIFQAGSSPKWVTGPKSFLAEFRPKSRSNASSVVIRPSEGVLIQ
jgi:hypothetical protein